jgi:VanZ family protein
MARAGLQGAEARVLNDGVRKRLLVVLFWGAWTFALVMALLPHPPQVMGETNDKVQHIAAFVTLSMLASFAYPKARLLRIGVLLSVFGAAIEVLQAIPALHRDSSFWDWVADTAAVAVTLVLVRAFLSSRRI